MDMVPFDAVNSSGFLRLMKIMEPRFEVASHTYYSSQTEVIHERLKSKLIAKVATDNPKQVSVALDGWSENHAGVLDSLEILSLLFLIPLMKVGTSVLLMLWQFHRNIELNERP